MQIPQSIDFEKHYSHQFTLCTLVTDQHEYGEMIASAQRAGFSSENTEFLFLDNTNGNKFDGFAGVNLALRQATGRYLIFCHQDVLFDFDNCAQLQEKIAQLEKKDERWAVLGNAGKTAAGNQVIRISDPYRENGRIGNFPSQVASLDENFLVLNREQPISCSANLQGFHLYATDLCRNAAAFGLNCYVIDFHVRHKSPGHIGASFRQAEIDFGKVLRQRMKPVFIRTLCSQFFVSNSLLLNLVFGNRHVSKLVQSIAKRLERKQ